MGFLDFFKPLRKRKKVLVIGLDCAPPELVFDKLKPKLKNLRFLMDKGTYGNLISCDPPITAPAWACMTSGKSPGQLGVYGFRHRKVGSYNDKYFAFSSSIKHKRVWDILSEEQKKVIILGVPQTFPVNKVNGYLVSSFLTPSTESDYTYPASLKPEIESLSRFDGKWATSQKGYMLDVEKFRTADKKSLLRRIYEMTEKQSRVMQSLLKNKEWDFAMSVFMGPDRIHHGFWKYMDEKHRDYVPQNKWISAIPDYYEYLDGEIGKILELIDNEPIVFVVSDHGAQKLDGCICINEWLIKNGYLSLKNDRYKKLLAKDDIERLNEEWIDWSKTKAWGWGGYYGRIFLNVETREPEGIIPPEDYEKIREGLIEELECIKDGAGNNIGTKVYRPEDLYSAVNGDPPDLFVYFGDLKFRSSSSIGSGSIYLYENDTGPDHANHAKEGIFIKYDPKRIGEGRVGDLGIQSVADQILDVYP